MTKTPSVPPTATGTNTLVVRAQGGISAAIGRLYEIITPEIQALGRRRIQPRMKARFNEDDLVQATWVEVLQSLPRFDRTVAPFRAWVNTIATRVLFREIDRCLRRQEGVQDEIVDGVRTTTPGRSIHAAEFKAAIVDLVNRLLAPLSEGDRLVLLNGWMDIPDSEIAAALGASTGAVQVRRHRALKRLDRKRFDDFRDVWGG